MSINTDQTVRLIDYKPPAYLVESVHLTFSLHPTKTRVKSRIVFTKNPEGPNGSLRLDGRVLNLISAQIDGKYVSLDVDKEGLTIPSNLLKENFIWECETEIDPSNNTSLEGLYMSGGMYCTQCEAEGFRKITYYPDRPDVMTVFTVRIEGDQPVLLSNGNPTDIGEGWAEWHDPWPKPSYLFALVAGDLTPFSDTFTTVSGRHVDLNIYVRDGDQDKCAYAMDSLKRSMRWDETEYGREYDLDLFNIVAVDDFNIGAMENKGLNIFNSALVLGSPETATDHDYSRIEGIIAHEYFHNWTGNRITCRDWFQLSLKEGLTVFRDQQFSGDMRDHSVKRIEDVQKLRTYQFQEDSGPLAHPPRPEEYIEINNFFTATVYNKGAAIVGMLKQLVGDEGYKKSLDLYFERHDGQAATIENWIAVFEDTTGRDLSQFMLWYSSAGTPTLTVTEDWKDGVFSLTLSQSTQPTPGQKVKEPRLIPVAIGLLYPDGSEARPTQILEFGNDSETFLFENLRERPIPSVLRGFSAPVNLNYERTGTENAFLLAHDSDPFNKWEAGRNYALNILTKLIDGANGIDPNFLSSMKTVATDENLDPAFRALAISIPKEDAISAHLLANNKLVDPIAISRAIKTLNKALALKMSDVLSEIYDQLRVAGPFTPNASAAGKRALRSRILNLSTLLDPKATQAKQQFNNADNMTEQMDALNSLIVSGNAENALNQFYDQWSHDKLVIDKWFSAQASLAPMENVMDAVTMLSNHGDFDMKNPNRFRSLIGAFGGGNSAGFHIETGEGYNFVADWIIKLDPHNPQISANACTLFSTWKQYAPHRQAKMKAALQRISMTENLSKDASEIVGKLLVD